MKLTGQSIFSMGSHRPLPNLWKSATTEHVTKSTELVLQNCRPTNSRSLRYNSSEIKSNNKKLNNTTLEPLINNTIPLDRMNLREEIAITRTVKGELQQLLFHHFNISKFIFCLLRSMRLHYTTSHYTTLHHTIRN